MTTPPNPHFSTVPLEASFNVQRSELPERLRMPADSADRYEQQTIRGIPFLFGGAHAPNVVLLEDDAVSIDLSGATATYVLFVHAVEDARDLGRLTFAEDEADGYRLGNLASAYELEYESGASVSVPIRRRFAIQQSRYSWGSAPFACIPAADDTVLLAADELMALGQSLPPLSYALAPTRNMVAYLEMNPADSGLLWIYALQNPSAELPLRRVVCRPREERSAIYAVTLTDVIEHPLRPGVRRKLRFPLPEGVKLNAIGEVDDEDIRIDLGVVISARAALEYDHERWASEEAVVEPLRSDSDVIVEYAAHPQAQLYLGEAVHELGSCDGEAVEVAAAERPVRLRFIDRESGAGVAVRLHVHGAAGEYLPPRGHHRKVNRVWHQDNYAEFANVENQYAYVRGECVVDLPLGTVYVEITCGYEIVPVRTAVEVGPDTNELVFELKRGLRWREKGWVTADTHVHFLSPQTALLEGQAEGVNVVNLLASQWGEMFSNVGDFDGSTTFGANDLDGRGEFLVRVGSENRMQILGHISLLGYAGELIHPLCTAGPDESAFGDPLEVTMAEWAQRCIDQGGIVVMPHSPAPQLERAADVVLGVVNAIELMHLNPLHPRIDGFDMPPLNPYGITDWYRYLNLGYHLPLVGGSDKMSAGGLLGGIRTYAQLGERELTYENWMDAIRVGNTFVTVGPLAALNVEGVEPGGQLRLPSGGGAVQIEWQVESLRVPVERVEIIVGGVVSEDTNVGGELAAQGGAHVQLKKSTWVALRVRGSYHGRPGDIAAHTSAVQVLVDGSELFSETDSNAVLDQIQGAIAYVDTIAPRPEARRFRELRATLEVAYNRLHQRMHAAGVYHHHPLHDPAQPHEH